jgi:hypothetical protein
MTDKKSFKRTRGKQQSDPSNASEIDDFGILLEESVKFCAAMDLPRDLIVQIVRTDSDWAFILKIDALLEAACKAVIRHGFDSKEGTDGITPNRIKRGNSVLLPFPHLLLQWSFARINTYANT